MLSRERVITTIEHGKPDRIPVYAWVKANMREPITERFGSVEAFEDKYEFDYSHIFGGPTPYDGKEIEAIREDKGAIEPGDALAMAISDPNNHDAYEKIKEQVRFHKEERGRFVYVQTPGIFECLNGVFGIENHLAYLLLFEEELKQVYNRQAEWSAAFAENCLDIGVDMVHVSDDWGAQTGLMFSPDTWWNMIYPYHKKITDAVKARDAFVSLHSDGNVTSVLDGIVDLGYDVIHPFQESAGMDYSLYKRDYRSKFTLMGGIDVQTTLGFGKLDKLRSEIERVVDTFSDGGLLLCTTHFVQDHCTIDELTFAYDLIYEFTRR